MKKQNLILIGAILLSASSCCPPPQEQVCPAAVHPDAVTRQWLASLNPPSEAVHYFNLIADQQEAIERACQ